MDLLGLRKPTREHQREDGRKRRLKGAPWRGGRLMEESSPSSTDRSEDPRSGDFLNSLLPGALELLRLWAHIDEDVIDPTSPPGSLSILPPRDPRPEQGVQEEPADDPNDQTSRKLHLYTSARIPLITCEFRDESIREASGRAGRVSRFRQGPL